MFQGFCARAKPGATRLALLTRRPDGRALLLAVALWALAPQTVGAQMLSGSYVGDGTDNRAITELGFQPDVVIVKGDTAQIGVIRTATMTGDAAKPMTGATALTANLIQSLNPAGFTVGNDARVNSNGVNYYWVAWRGLPGRMSLGTYTGNGAAGRTINGIGFPGDIVFVMSQSAGSAIAATSSSLAAGANGLTFFTTSAGGWFQSFTADGFTLGAAAAENNANGVTYHYIVWNQVDGHTRQGSYVGNGADNRNISGLGFEPEYVITFSSNNQEAAQHSGAIGAAVDYSMFFAGIAGLTNRIQALQADGFQVGTALDVNENTRTHFYMAWTRIQGPPQVLSGSYTGDGIDDRTITGLGFRPDFVIVKGQTNQTAVFRSSRMFGNASKPAVGPTALTANLVQTLDADGFTVGTDARVNASGVVYHWIAFSAGAGEMVNNNYTGNGLDNRSITGLGFQPNYVIVMSEGANDAVHRSSAMVGNISFEFDITGSASNLIQALETDGFQIGTDARVNANGTVYQYVAWNRIVGKMEVGSYSGDGSDDRAVTGVGFQPEYMIVRPSSANSTVHHSAAMGTSTDWSERFWASGGLTNAIQALQADGFEVGTDATVNVSPNTYYWMAWKRPTLTAVKMAGMTASRTEKGVTVTWRTGYEVDNVGFEVHREAGGERTRVTTKPIAGSALFVPAGIPLAAGRSYSWTDESPQAVETGVSYWIEDIDLNGTRTWHGPIVPKARKTTEQTRGSTASSQMPPRDVPPRSEVVEPSQLEQPTNSLLLEDLKTVQPEAQPSSVPLSNPSEASALPTVAQGAIHVGIAPRTATGGRTDPAATGVWRRGPAQVATITRSASNAATAQPNAATRPSASSIAVQGAERTSVPVALAPSTAAASIQAPLDSPAAAELTEPGGSRTTTNTTGTTARTQSAGIVAVEGGRPPVYQELEPVAPGNLRFRARPLITAVSGTPREPDAAVLQQQWAIAGQAAARIAIRSSGWYRVTQPVLVAAGISASVNPRQLHLVVDGVERPMIVTGESDGSFDTGDAVEFYGTGADTPYTDRRIYWVTAGATPGLRTPLVDARTGGTPGGPSFAHTVERKDRQIFFAALQNGDDENFFGPLVMDGEPTTQELTLPYVATMGADAQLEVALQGVTTLPSPNDHRVGVFVNDTEVGEMTFDGRSAATSLFAVPHAILSTGINTIRFEARGGVDDMTLVDHVRLTYQREYRADGNQVTFDADGDQQLTLTGFSNGGIRVFDVTSGDASQELLGTIATEGGGYAITFTVPAGAARRLFVTTSDTLGVPATVEANQPSGLNVAGQSGDVVMITHAAFASALTPLRDVRQSQGHTVQIVSVQDIYDEFAFGQKTPEAIRRFLTRAAASWTKPPRYVLLVGNATTDPRDYQGLGEPDFVPTKILATGVLETASDDWFADADGDSFADLASVGRLPARSAAEAALFVDKIVGYERSSSEAWHRSVLLVSDDGRSDLGEGEAGAFAALNAQLAAIVPSTYQVHHLRRDQDPTAAQTLRTRLSEGAFLVNYQGHGSVDLWRGDLLTGADAATLDNGSRLPLVVAMTCFSGFFHGLFPEESLAEALLRAPNGGAIGVWASSGMTDAAWQASLTRELGRQVFGGTWTSVGDALRAAKKVVGSQDVRRTWIFFGDPALRLKGLSHPPDESTPTVTPVLTPPDPADSGAPPEENPDTRRRAEHVAVQLTDLDGDARADAFLIDPQSGSWLSHLGTPGSFRETTGQFNVPGDALGLKLNADNRGDLFVYDTQTGQWLQAMSTGDGRFVTSTGSWAAGLEVVAGDFDGNGRDDLFAHHPNGSWVQAFSDGDGDYSYRHGSGLPAGSAYTADFNGDGRTDVFVYNPSSGQWTMVFSVSGSAPALTHGTWTPGWQPVVARLNADAAADLVLWHAESGTWVQCVRDASQFFVYRTGTWVAGGRVHAADLDADGRDELLRYDWRTGGWTLAHMDNAGSNQQWDGVWEIGWELTPGDMNGDGRQDLLLYNPETGEWIRRLNLVSGWVDDVSGLWSRNWTVAGRRR